MLQRLQPGVKPSCASVPSVSVHDFLSYSVHVIICRLSVRNSYLLSVGCCCVVREISIRLIVCPNFASTVVLSQVGYGSPTARCFRVDDFILQIMVSIATVLGPASKLRPVREPRVRSCFVVVLRIPLCVHFCCACAQ